MCTGREFQADGAETEKARWEKLLAILDGLVRRFVSEIHAKSVLKVYKASSDGCIIFYETAFH